MKNAECIVNFGLFLSDQKLSISKTLCQLLNMEKDQINAFLYFTDRYIVFLHLDN